MRLSPNEISAIKKTILGIDAAAVIYLFGSRVQDDLKGGDIDLVVLSTKLSFTNKLDILAEIKSLIGDQKIDLRIVEPEALQSDPFLLSIKNSMVRL